MSAHRRTVKTLVLLAVLAICLTHAAQAKSKDVFLSGGFPVITDEQKSLSEVKFAKGAPAVVLLVAKQVEWQEMKYQRVRYFRRIKILNDAGVEAHGDFESRLYGDWRLQSVKARTVLADGTVADAKDGENIFRDKSEDSGLEVVNIAFPQVVPGAILDLNVEMNVDALNVSPWIVQESLPVIESRYVMVPPTGLRYGWAVLNESGKPTKPDKRSKGLLKAVVWSFENVPPLPDLAHLPPSEDIAEQLVIFLESYKDDFQYFAFARDWKQYSKRREEYWDEWIKRSHKQAEALADSVTAGKSSPKAKAEAIHAAVRERVRNDRNWDYPMHEHPDEVLEKGHGTSADIAGLTLAMLRSANVAAVMTGIRRRSGGLLPIEKPVPALVDDVLIQLRAGKEPIYFSPASSLPIGKLPWDCTGLITIPFDGKTEKPVVVPEVAAEDNAVARTASVELTADGKLVGESTHVFHGAAADSWRRRLRDLDDQKRRERLQREFEETMPGVVIGDVSVENLDGTGPKLTVNCQWEAGGYAASAGSRILVNPHLFSRIYAEDWSGKDRQYPIDLRVAYEERDEVTFKLPEGVQAVDLPQPANLNAGPVGFLTASYEKRGNTVVAKRHMRLNMYRFPPESFAGLSRWFSDIATADDQALVVKLER
ncbi:MAG: DUF3857 domain-containing protein [Acidobacteriota bacterium]|nr:MAG: DUF3857 domain-containing protein [Acidobacteriota bacterium]